MRLSGLVPLGADTICAGIAEALRGWRNCLVEAYGLRVRSGLRDGANAGPLPQSRSNAELLQYRPQALRLRKGRRNKWRGTHFVMDERVLEFAERMRAKADALGETGHVEWRLSPAPVPYEAAVAEMETRAGAILLEQKPELIWLLEHPPLYTAGTSSKPADLIDATRFPVHASGRGGQYTYHGPGQLVAYVLLDLNKRGRDVRQHVHRLEAWAIAALAPYGISGERREGRPGIWVKKPGGDAKIAAIGVRVRRWVTYHGIAVNVCPDLSHFSGIVPCGIADAGVTSMEDECRGFREVPPHSVSLPEGREDPRIFAADTSSIPSPLGEKDRMRGSS